MKNILRISALISVMLALLAIPAFGFVTPTIQTQTAQVSQASQHDAALAALMVADPVFSPPPVVGLLSDQDFISAQRFKIEPTVLPAGIQQFLVFQVGADPKISQPEMVVSMDNLLVNKIEKLLAKDGLTNDAGGKIIASEQKKFNAEMVNVHFYS